MGIGLGKLTEIRQEAGGTAGALACPQNMQPAPGQYLLATSEHPGEVLPIVLFASALPGGDLQLAPPLPDHWGPGQALRLRGPLGRGFNLPDAARRVALYTDQASPGLLLPLAQLALQRSAAVTLYAHRTPANLPADIEILPAELLPEALDWADYLAACLPHTRLAELRRSLGLSVRQVTRCRIEALLIAPMPCAGMAECGACAVLTRSGWRHICSDGPVFELDQLEE
jgi:NAD(P)H-flavin reductase